MRRILLLTILLLPFLAQAELKAEKLRTITGKVLDASTGEPLIGATVFLDPTNKDAESYVPQGTVTDVNGEFKYTLPSFVTKVVISFIGYETKYVDIVGKQPLLVKLNPDQEELDEVVVTGYQKIEQRKVTSSISTVKMDDIERIGVASVDQLLEGQIAGLTSVPTNGAPGAPNKLRIRSTVSLSGSTDPLWVLDGMILEGNDIPANFNDKESIDELYNTSIAGVNPADIQDITVLKDAAATAIYGARAANGVIIVTTKRGKAGKPRVNFSAATFYTLKPDMSKLDLMNSQEKVDFELMMAGRSDLSYRDYTGEVSRIIRGANELDAYRENGFSGLSGTSQDAINALREKNTNWGDVIYQNALNQQYNVSVSGGSEKSRYYFSGGYYNEEGATKNTGFNRYNLTMKVDFDLHKKLNVATAIFFTQSKRKSYISDGDGHTNPSKYSRTANPYLSVYDENGKYMYDKDIEGYSDRPIDFNFVEEMNNTDYSLRNRSIKPMVDVNYKATSWLTLTSKLGLQIEDNATEKLSLENSYYTRKYRERSYENKEYLMPEGGVIQNWNNTMTQFQAKFQGEVNKTFNEKHELDVMTGFEIRGSEYEQIATKGFGYDEKSLTTKPMVLPSNSNIGNNPMFKQYARNENIDRFLSYYMTAAYTFNDKYTFFGSMRYDGSNMFGVDRKYKYLPLWSASAAWNMGREDFIKNLGVISQIKWRLSYGIQGNVDKNTSPFVVGEWNNTTLLPDVNNPNINVTAPPNQYLRWEKTSNWNAGLDFGILRNRISFSLDWYHRVSDDLIGTRALPGENGFDFSTMNWAKLTNKGFEFSLSTVNIRTKDFTWSTNFNLAHNKSVINKMNVRDNSYEPSREGYSVGAMFALKTAGMDENGVPMFFNKKGEKVSLIDFYKLSEGSQMGGIITFLKSDLTHSEYRDLFHYVGTSEPKFTGGLTNRFRYKGWDLSIAGNFTIKQTVKETPFYTPTRTIPGQNYSRKILDVWTPENPDGIYPGFLGRSTVDGSDWAYSWMNEMDPGNSFNNYDIWYKTLSYFRINSIRLGYNLPENFLNKIGINQARFSVEARNPFVFGSSYKGYFDPETYGNQYAQPIAKTYSVGVDLTF